MEKAYCWSGAGFIKNLKKKFIYFDGDQFRKIFNNDINYTLKSRDINAQRLTSLVKYLSDQKIQVLKSIN